jgi:hypothetical protein
MGLERIPFVETMLNLFICELGVLVCHIHHVTNEASLKKELLEAMKKFCGRRK